MTDLITEAELAERLKIDPVKAAELRRVRNWPHVRLTRFDVRYTDAQVEQVLALQSVEHKRTEADVAALAAGQSRRSASRKAS